MAKKFEPYGHRIIVEKITEKERGGLVVPGQYAKKALIGRVLHIGPEVADIAEGDVVLFAQFSGCAPFMDTDLRKSYSEDILVMNDEDILSFVRDVPATAEVAAETV